MMNLSSMKSKTQLVILITAILVIFWTVEAECRGGRGGGARSGGSRYSGSRSSRGSYSSRYTSSYSSRRGSTYTSSYISYVPTSRYSRAYLGYRGYYYTYYNMYFYYSGTYVYTSRSRPSANAYVCANYEADANGTSMGVFLCPNTWEPANFKYCCGKDYAEYCCKEKKSNVGMIIGVTIAVVIILIIVIYIIYKMVQCGVCCSGTTEETTSTVVTHTTTITHDAPEYPGGGATYNNAAYDNTKYGRGERVDDPPSYGMATQNKYEAPAAAGYQPPPPDANYVQQAPDGAPGYGLPSPSGEYGQPTGAPFPPGSNSTNAYTPYPQTNPPPYNPVNPGFPTPNVDSTAPGVPTAPYPTGNSAAPYPTDVNNSAPYPANPPYPTGPTA